MEITLVSLRMRGGRLRLQRRGGEERSEVAKDEDWRVKMVLERKIKEEDDAIGNGFGKEWSE